MSHAEFDELAAGFTLDALAPEERARFEAHLAEGCAQCRAALAEADEALVALARSEPPTIPPAHVKERLMRRVAAGGAARRLRGAPRVTVTAWAVTAAAAALLVVVTAALTASYTARREAARLEAMAGEVAALRETVDLLGDPATRVVSLHGLGPSANAAGRILYRPDRGGQLVVLNLPPTPEGKAYELWTIGSGGPRPAGVFRVGAAGRAVHSVPALPGLRDVQVFAVTLEPAAGVAAPTGPMMLTSGT